MLFAMDFGNGVKVDCDLLHDCALEALGRIEKRLPEGAFCVGVCDQIADDMKESVRASTISIAQKYPGEHTK